MSVLFMCACLKAFLVKRDFSIGERKRNTSHLTRYNLTIFLFLLKGCPLIPLDRALYLTLTTLHIAANNGAEEGNDKQSLILCKIHFQL